MSEETKALLLILFVGIPILIMIFTHIARIIIREKELQNTRTNLFNPKETKKQIKHQQTLIAKMLDKLKKGK